jgi:N-methylhydantoinase B/oxoprolinase/acetone carboxylase alpha subunit
MRDEIRKIPKGEYVFEDVMENDGISNTPHRIKVLLTVRDDEIIADFNGSAPQTRGPINATYAVTAAATYNAVFHLTDANIPRNAGCNRPIKVLAPPGSIVNARRPAAEVGGNSETHCRMIGIVMGALAQAVPERAAAADGATGCNFLFGGIHPETGRYYANYHFENVGWGASAVKDGNDSQCAPLAISRNVPVEVFESRYPILVRSFRLLPDSGGAGQRRGGLGTERIFEVMADEITISALFDRMQVPPWGLEGGGNGGTTDIAYQGQGEDEFKSFIEAFGTVSPSKFTNIIVYRGDRIRIISSGGGGFGDPKLRPVQAVLDDVYDHYISADSALNDYAVKLEGKPGKWRTNEEATSRLRELK